MTGHAVPPENGFTLLEILVALLVLGLVAGGLGQGLRSGFQAWDRAAAIAGRSDALDAMDRTLRQLVAQARPSSDAAAAPFVGESDRLAFVTALPDLPGRAAQPVEAQLMVDALHRLVLRTRPYIHARRRDPPPFAETELLGGVSRLELAFWHAESGWTTNWAAPGLPALLRIRLDAAGAGERRWPDIVVAPGLDRP
jgi:general secretion pathway protein J